MIGPMQIAYIVLVIFGLLEHTTADYSDRPVDKWGASVQGGTIFWLGLILLVVSVFVKIFG